jgi:hypothetical protein
LMNGWAQGNHGAPNVRSGVKLKTQENSA